MATVFDRQESGDDDSSPTKHSERDSDLYLMNMCIVFNGHVCECCIVKMYI